MHSFRLSTGSAAVDAVFVHRYLSEETYWAKGIAFGTVRKAIDHSLCVGGFIGTEQVAFGRAVTDLATFAYLRDIFVVPPHRGKGYGKAIVQALMTQLIDNGVSGIMLATSDCHGLYEKFGFERLDGSPKLMRWNTDLVLPEAAKARE